MNRTVAAFGVTSLLSDAGHEMATSVLPIHLARLGLGATALGVVEGIADAAAGLAKLAGGVAGQRIARKKPWTSAGYAVTAVCTSALGFASTVPGFVALRSIGVGGRVDSAAHCAIFSCPFGLENALLTPGVRPRAGWRHDRRRRRPCWRCPSRGGAVLEAFCSSRSCRLLAAGCVMGSSGSVRTDAAATNPRCSPAMREDSGPWWRAVAVSA
jgi:hypothetical protein